MRFYQLLAPLPNQYFGLPSPNIFDKSTPVPKVASIWFEILVGGDSWFENWGCYVSQH